MWTREHNRFAWAAYRGDEQIDEAQRGWFSPALADDLAGLPRTWIATGSLDLFFDETFDYAHRLAAAGVTVEFHSYGVAPNGFNASPGAVVARLFASHYTKAVTECAQG